MKVVILAGGRGTRLGEESYSIPKPMTLIGGRPILWHIMKFYSSWGFNEFVILLGYKGDQIIRYFSEYLMMNSPVTIDLKDGSFNYHDNHRESWKVTLLDTGEETMTGGRLKRAAPYLEGDRFMLTYGDGVSDINLPALLDQHLKTKATVTLSAVNPPGRFGVVNIIDNFKVNVFKEKIDGANNWVNGGFFICENKFLNDLPNDDSTVLEGEPMEKLAREGKLCAYKHQGFWRCMDTLRDKNDLNELWDENAAKWKTW